PDKIWRRKRRVTRDPASRCTVTAAQFQGNENARLIQSPRSLCCKFANAIHVRCTTRHGVPCRPADEREMTPPSAAPFDIRFAQPADVGVIVAMIRELAEFERLAHLCVATEAELSTALFGPQTAAEVLISWKADEPTAFALFFHNFSTFLG